jgi:hypothetical protein
MSAPDPSRWTLPRLAINEDGEWLHEGLEITHPGIVASLQGSLRRDASGYFLQAGPIRVPVEVADAPFVVVRVEARGDDLRVLLNDGSDEALDPATLRLSRAEVPYCRVKGGRFEARLSRAAAWELGKRLEYDEATDLAVLHWGGITHPLRRE